jgi:hypothetical protein
VRVGIEEAGPEWIKIYPAGRQGATAQGGDLDPGLFELAVEPLDLGRGGLGYAQAPRQPLGLVDRQGELGQPACALRSVASVVGVIHHINLLGGKAFRGRGLTARLRKHPRRSQNRLTFLHYARY